MAGEYQHCSRALRRFACRPYFACPKHYDVVSQFPPLNVVLHQPEIPQNTGNIGRTCVALNAKLWLVRPLGFYLDQKSLRRAGLDYWERLQLEVVDQWEEVPRSISSSRLWFFTKRADMLYTKVAYEPGDALVFGGEAKGLPRSLLEQHPDRLLRIPIGPGVRSLNLASAVAVAAYEAVRQWSTGSE